MKRILSFCMALAFLLVITPLCFARTPKIVDQAGLLTNAQVEALERRAQEMADRFGIDVVIVTAESLGGKTARDYADDFFDNNGYGIGADHSGILFLLSTEYRDWWISTCGKGIPALTQREIDALFDSVSGYLADDRWYLAFSGYLDALEDHLSGSFAGTTDGPDHLIRFVIAFLIGAATGGITIYIMRRKMNTATKQSGATSYMVDGSYRLEICRDMFLYGHTSRVRRQENNGGSTHRSSSGRSHGGGGGRF